MSPTAPLRRNRPHVAATVLRECMIRQPLLTWFSGFMLGLAVLTTVLLIVDDRTWRDVGVWVKPLKFMLSTAAFAATTAWFVGLLPGQVQASAQVRSLAWVVVLTSAFEVGYISVQAALGEGSHHNVSDQLHAMLFGLMAFAAVCLTATQALLAWLIARHSPMRHTPFVDAVVVGLGLTFLLATVSGFLLGAQQPPPGVGVPFLGWHLGQADARPAHFLGVHAQQLLPLAGWLIAQTSVARPRLWLGAFSVAYVVLWGVLIAWALA